MMGELTKLVEDMEGLDAKINDIELTRRLKAGLDEEPEKFPEFIIAYQCLLKKISPMLPMCKIREDVLKDMAKRCFIIKYAEMGIFPNDLLKYSEGELNTIFREFFLDTREYNQSTRVLAKYIGLEGKELFDCIFEGKINK